MTPKRQLPCYRVKIPLTNEIVVCASVRPTAVDQTDARNAESRIALGVSALSAPGTSACARMSMCPKQIGLTALRAAAVTTEARVRQLSRLAAVP